MVPWIARFGVPSTITTDRGSQFESALWSNLMQLLGSKRKRTTAYHPVANGMIERLHRQLKAALKCHLNPATWTDSLPMVLLGIRTALKEDLRCTTAELVYGTTLRLPGEFFVATQDVNLMDSTSYVTKLKTTMQELQAPQVRPAPQRQVHIGNALTTCTHVFVWRDAVKKPLQTPYDGPYRVLQRKDKYYIVEVKGRAETISMDRLKPAYLDSTATPSQQPEPPVPSPPTPTTNLHLSPQAATPHTVTRAGRKVHWPTRLADFCS